MFYLIKDDYSAKISQEFLSLIKQIKDAKHLKLESLSLIDTAFKRFLGFSSSFVNSVSEKDLLNLMKKNDEIQGIQCAIGAALLFEEGNIFYDEEKYNEAYFRYSKAFNLISNIFVLNLDCELEGYIELSEEIAGAVENFETTSEDQEKLFYLYKSIGIYSKAEDHLYDLMNDPLKKEFAKNKLKEFYNELLEKKDEDLIQGNLPRHEILESLKASSNK
ncbi:DUF6483 family protein [Clostridium arbusti]|uniref:DUF6483 family protein n=1 Tax=Clostridium arbusti TaxID=1137848 RepID=UPI0035A23D71